MLSLVTACQLVLFLCIQIVSELVICQLHYGQVNVVAHKCIIFLFIKNCSILYLMYSNKLFHNIEFLYAKIEIA